MAAVADTEVDLLAGWLEEVVKPRVRGRDSPAVGGVRFAFYGEFFDVGESRRQDWSDRPEATALLGSVADAGRGFDAVVVGEYERAFSRGQLLALLLTWTRPRRG